MAWQFLTVPEELLEHAECAANHFSIYGYKVKAEHSEIEYPYLPAIHCRRPPRTMLVEVSASVPADRMKAWALYARSCQRDTRVAVVVPKNKYVASEHSVLGELGVGLYVSNGQELQEIIPPQDLALQVQLPELKTHPPRMRKILGPIHEEFEHSQWREGFESACQAVEVLARKYLKLHMASGRIAFVSVAGNQINYTQGQVGKMPMGALSGAFKEIQNQNYSDARIGAVLSLINKDRVGVAHYKGQALQEARLRKNVGRHMYRVFAAMRELLGIKA